jgi:hypothetical protein
MGRDRVPAADMGPAEGAKQCVGKNGCGRWKPLADFAWNEARGRYDSWCKICTHIYHSRRRRTPAAREAQAAYRATPRARELHAASIARRADKIRADKRASSKTVKGRVAEQLRKARRRLATAIRRVDELRDLVRAYESELKRIKES